MTQQQKCCHCHLNNTSKISVSFICNEHSILITSKEKKSKKSDFQTKTEEKDIHLQYPT